MDTSLMYIGRVIAALLAASLIGAFGATACAHVFASDITLNDSQYGFVYLSLYAWVCLLPFIVLFGGGAYWLLSKYQIRAVTAYTFSGMLLAPLAVLAWTIVFEQSFEWLDPMATWLSIIGGGITALIFRLFIHSTIE